MAFNPEYSLAPFTASYLPSAAFFLQICSQHDPSKDLARPLTLQAGLGQRWRAWQAGVQGESGAGGSALWGQACPPLTPCTHGASLSAPQAVPTPSLGKNPRTLSLKVLTSKTRSRMVLTSQALEHGQRTQAQVLAGGERWLM